jgi:hypothetical protein
MLRFTQRNLVLSRVASRVTCSSVFLWRSLEIPRLIGCLRVCCMDEYTCQYTCQYAMSCMSLICVFERTREPGRERSEQETGGRTCRQSLHRLKCTRRHLGMRDCFRLLVDCSVNLSCPLKRTPPCFRSSLPLDLYRRGPLAVRRCDKLRYVK